MSAKAIVTRAVILAWLGGGVARVAAQAPPAGPEQLPAPAAPDSGPLPSIMPSPSQIPAIQAGLPPGSVPDPWITYDRPGCCGPIGADGPISSEIYARTGPSIPTGSSIIRQGINTGWLSEFGGRALLFNRDTNAAWTGDFGIDYTFNDGGGHPEFPLRLLFPTTITNPFTGQAITNLQFGTVPITIRDYQRVAVRLSGGREWFLPPGYCPGWHFRFGTDIGGRWGTSRLDMNDLTRSNEIDFRHQSDVYGAVVLSIHSDLEAPIGPRLWFIAGTRAEWAYNFSDVLKNALPSQKSDTGEINLLLNFGVRF
jgi:hypothetical protein